MMESLLQNWIPLCLTLGALLVVAVTFTIWSVERLRGNPPWFGALFGRKPRG